MRAVFGGVLLLLAFVGHAETYGNPASHWFILESTEVSPDDVITWTQVLGPERAAIFMHGSDVVTFEAYCGLIGWDAWEKQFIDVREIEFARQQQTAEFVLTGVSALVAGSSFGSNPPLGISLTVVSIVALLRSVLAHPELSRSTEVSPRTWADLMAASAQSPTEM